MSGLQTIVDAAAEMTIDRRKVVGVQVSRNEIPKTSVTPTRQPWRFSVTVPNSFRYSEARSLMEALDTLDRSTPETVTFSNNPNLAWLFNYQGVMTQGQVDAITVTSFVGNQLVLGNLPAISSTAVLFEPNDLIQIGLNKFPFTSTTQVLRGSGSTVTVTTHRPNIITSSVVGDDITVGNDCTFTLFCPNMPTYKLIPGGLLKQNGTVISNALLEFSGSFDLYEWTGSA